MSKELPNPINDIFDHNQDNIESSTGISIDKTNERIIKLSETYYEQSEARGFCNVSTLAEETMKTLTHKELAVLWSKNIIDAAK